jgi:predicted RNA-binding protein with PIN domain
MPYLIDGHNLIAQTPGLRLSDPDDEMRLVSSLRPFCRRKRAQLTVYFDRGRAGSEASLSSGSIKIHFIRPPGTADQAIRAHLARLRGEARNWVVVSSDREVQAAARAAGARVVSSRDFVRELQAVATRQAEKPEIPSPDDIAYWERRFGQKRKRSSR